MKWLLHLCFCYYFKQAHFLMFNGLLVFLFVKLLYYTSYFFFQKLHPFFCVLLNLWFEKLKLCPIILMLDWFHA